MRAEEARKITYESCKKDFQEILDVIKETAENGCDAVNVSVNTNIQNIDKLIELGYSVELYEDEFSEEKFWLVSW